MNTHVLINFEDVLTCLVPAIISRVDGLHTAESSHDFFLVEDYPSLCLKIETDLGCLMVAPPGAKCFS